MYIYIYIICIYIYIYVYLLETQYADLMFFSVDKYRFKEKRLTLRDIAGGSPRGYPPGQAPDHGLISWKKPSINGREHWG